MSFARNEISAPNKKGNKRRFGEKKDRKAREKGRKEEISANEKKNFRKTNKQKASCHREPTMHYGTKPGHFETSIIHFLISNGVSERANE